MAAGRVPSHVPRPPPVAGRRREGARHRQRRADRVGGGGVLRRARLRRPRRSTTTCGPTSSARAATPRGTASASRRPAQRYTHHDIDIRDRAAIDDLVAAGRLRAGHPRRRPAEPRPRRVPPLRRLRRERRRHPQPARGGPAPHARGRVHHDVAPTRSTATTRTACRSSSSRPAGTTPTPRMAEGIDETMSLDHCTHSLFGASKVAADVLTQEYGRYFGLRTGTFRGGCLTGPHHAGVELHGFLSYLVLTALREGPYTIFGYKGKQVRDQIHSADVISAFWAFAQDPRPGRGVQPRRRQGQRRQPARVRRARRRRVGRQATRAHLRRAGSGRRPHLLLLGHGQVPGPLPRLAAGARPRRPSSRRWWPASRRSSS